MRLILSNFPVTCCVVWLLHRNHEAMGSPHPPVSSHTIRGRGAFEESPWVRQIPQPRQLHEEKQIHQQHYGHHHNHSNHGNNTDDATPFPVDISSYSIRFEKCQGIKLSEHSAAAVERFVVFRLCPRHECAACDANFGEYVLPLVAYLDILSGYFHDTKDRLCKTCPHCLNVEEKDTTEAILVENFDSTCATCADECAMLDRLQASGGSSYVDATNFLSCTLIYDNGNDYKLYAGPVCAQGGNAVTIGVFTDAQCAVQDQSQQVRDFVFTPDGESAQLAYSFLKQTYLETCLSCQEDSVQSHSDWHADQQDTDKVKNFCEHLYQDADKCEVPHGFAAPSSLESTGASAAQQAEACNFIHQIQSNKHSAPREFVPNDSSSIGAFAESEVSSAQMMIVIIAASILLVLFCVCRFGCNADARAYRKGTVSSDDEELHAFESDDHIIKILDSDDDNDVELTNSYKDELDETEEESSSFSLAEEMLLMEISED